MKFDLRTSPIEEFENYFYPLFPKTTSSTMKTDIKETEKELFVNVLVPGIKKDDIDLNYEKGYLTISYEHKEENNKGEKEKYLRKEIYYSSASRSFYVGDVDIEKVEATYNDGVLNIVLPKLIEEEKKNKITIK